MRQKSFLCLRCLKVEGRSRIYFGLKVPVHGRGLLGDFSGGDLGGSVEVWGTDHSAPAASLRRWDEILAVGVGLLTVPHTEHPGDGVCLAVVSEGCYNV